MSRERRRIANNEDSVYDRGVEVLDPELQANGGIQVEESEQDASTRGSQRLHSSHWRVA